MTKLVFDDWATSRPLTHGGKPMGRIRLIAGHALVLLLMMSTVIAADDKPATDAERDGETKAPAESGKTPLALEGEYVVLTQEAGLSDEQRERLAVLVNQRDEEAVALYRKNAKRIQALKAQMKKAGDDKEKVAEGRREITEIYGRPLRLMREAYDGKISGLMEPDQRTRWYVCDLVLGEMKRLKGAELTETQASLIRAQAITIAGSRRNEKAIRVAKSRRIELHEHVVGKVLTDDQRAALDDAAK